MTMTMNTHDDDTTIEAAALAIWRETYASCGEPPEFTRSAVWHFYLAEARRNAEVVR